MEKETKQLICAVAAHVVKRKVATDGALQTIKEIVNDDLLSLLFFFFAKDDALTLERGLLGLQTKSFRLSFTNGDSPLKVWILVGHKV